MVWQRPSNEKCPVCGSILLEKGNKLVCSKEGCGFVKEKEKEENKGKIAFFGGIKNCRFKGQVTPGDVLEMECVLTKQKGPVGIGEAIAKVNGKVVCKAELTFAIQ